jgi:hypothetical protein
MIGRELGFLIAAGCLFLGVPRKPPATFRRFASVVSPVAQQTIT